MSWKKAKLPHRFASSRDAECLCERGAHIATVKIETHRQVGIGCPQIRADQEADYNFFLSGMVLMNL